MGSPDFAVPSLSALAEKYSVVGVVTQPDRPAGRGRTMQPSPVKLLARKLDLPVVQPEKLSQAEAMEQLLSWKPDVVVVAAFGQILRADVLDLPPYGCINVHASLLPRWRGAAPIQAAILHGDAQTGVTIMLMDAGVDTGPILRQSSTPILPDDTAGRLSERLSRLGADLLIETLPGYLNGDIVPQPQNEADATYSPMLKKSDGELDFDQPAEKLARQIRAYQPWPGTFTFWKGQRLKIIRADVVRIGNSADSLQTGSRTIHNRLPAIVTARDLLVLNEVQPAGKKPMQGSAFLQGAREWA
jgi:methionyl-tRNA formyltransferase